MTRKPGALKGRIRMTPDFNAPLKLVAKATGQAMLGSICLVVVLEAVHAICIWRNKRC